MRFHDRSNPQALPVHTVKARWGSRPDPESGWRGYEPDWHVLTIKPDLDDRFYPFWVEGWLPAGNTEGPAGKPFIWKVSSLNDARYDLTEAVCLPPVGNKR
jgi:hypothetical protein